MMYRKMAIAQVLMLQSLLTLLNIIYINPVTFPFFSFFFEHLLITISLFNRFKPHTSLNIQSIQCVLLALLHCCLIVF